MALPIFVEPAWLREHLGDANLRIVDARSRAHGAPPEEPTGRELYGRGHIPGAVYLDYAEDLHDPATPYATRVAPAERFAEVLGASGIGDGDTIVAYDNGTIPFAARFLWMCRYYGHDDVHVLAGGFPGFIAAGGVATTDVPTPPRTTFTPKVRPELRASRDDVLAVSERRSDAQLLETQRDASYAARDLDIAGAIRLSGSLLLEDANGGRIASRERIEALLAPLDLDRTKRTIVSCGSGVSASGSYLALLEAGFTDVAVYDGSWVEWSHDGLPTIKKRAAE